MADSMTELTALEAAQALAAPVGNLGGRWMTDPATYAYGGELGIAGFAFYFVGRGSALGDVSGDVVASTMTFFPPALVGAMWTEGRGVLPPLEALPAFSECCWAWGRRQLADVPQLERTSALLARVVDGADSAALPLFAGWRQAARPTDLPAVTAHLLHLFRELRGGVHAVAVLATGLTPLEAITASAPTSGFGSPESFGWSEPLPVRTAELFARRRAAEELTDRITSRAFAVLDDAERAELVERVEVVAQSAKSG